MWYGFCVVSVGGGGKVEGGSDRIVVFSLSQYNALFLVSEKAVTDKHVIIF